MKTLIITCLSSAAVLSLCSCEGDQDTHHTYGGGHSTTTTTTEETTVHQPVSGTTETQTIRRY